MIVVFCFHFSLGQNSEETSPDKPDKFYIGFSYSFLDLDLKLHEMTLRSVWQEINYGAIELDKNEISELNSIIRYKNKFQDLCLEIGGIIVNKPGKKLKFNGNMMLGISRNAYSSSHKINGTTEIKAITEYSKPVVGIELTFNYMINDHWQLGIMPSLIYCWGKSSTIEDNLYPGIKSFTESRTHKFDYLYSRVTILAGYSLRNFTFSAGPGFYLVLMENDYRIYRFNPQNSASYEDTIHSHLYSKSFVDGCLMAEWRITGCLSMDILFAIGNDISVNPGIRYSF